MNSVAEIEGFKVLSQGIQRCYNTM